MDSTWTRISEVVCEWVGLAWYLAIRFVLVMAVLSVLFESGLRPIEF